MNFNEKLQQRIAELAAKKEQANIEAVEQLLNNEAFIESQATIAAKSKELRHLNALISQLTAIAPFISNDGTRYNINVYPISHFGTGVAQILGIIAGSRSAFTDDLMLQYEAITGIDGIELSEAATALGSPAYLNKEGIIVDAVEGDLDKLNNLLKSIAIKLGVFEFDIQISERDFERYYLNAERKALKQLKEFEKNHALALEDFTMEG